MSVFNASTKTNKSIRRALTGLKVEWMIMQSRRRDGTKRFGKGFAIGKVRDFIRR
jgi:uncharacterized membrane protein